MRGMYIIMDLVVNHCSDEHIWFQKAMQDPDGECGKYFYIAEKKDGKLPCNWRSYFGGSVWEPIPGTDKYYLHSFYKKQPDLNWENPKVWQKGRWDLNEEVTAEMYKEVVFDSQLRTGEIGFLSNIIENHDEPRGVSRYIPKADLSDKTKSTCRRVLFPARDSVYLSGAGDRHGKLCISGH